MNQQRIINTAIDTINRFKISYKYPLEKVANELVILRNLNNKERKALYNLTFSWARYRNCLEKFAKENVRNFKALSEYEKESLFIYLLASLDECNFTQFKSYSNYANLYKNWSCEQKDFYLLALGSLINSALGEKKNNYELIKSFFTLPKKTLDQKEIHNKTKEKELFMDEGAKFIASLIRPKAEEKVLDMCTGKGLKLKIIAQKFSADYYALDVDIKRLNVAKKQKYASTVKFQHADSRKDNFPENFFDWILLDAPCSGTGTIRRHPDIIQRLDKENLFHFVELQRSLLNQAIRILKPGGRLIYATCSILEKENEEQIEYFLTIKKDLSLLPLSFSLTGKLCVNDEDFEKKFINLSPLRHQSDGFFISFLTKNEK